MEASELLKKVRKIEIKTRGLSRHIFAGEYHSAFKGRGMTFSEVREYQYGDDIRNIDWNVTARFNHPYIKIFEEERELTVMLMIDVSGSRNFGSTVQMKKEMITEISAVLAFSAITNNDKIGVVLFSDQIEKFIPPKKGRKHILRIIRELLEFEPQSRATDIGMAFRFMTNAVKKRCTAFMVSDFLADGYDDALMIAARKHDVIALQIYDRREEELPDVGLVKFADAESDATAWVDTSDVRIRNDYARQWRDGQARRAQLFRKAGVDSAKIRTDEDYVKSLMQLFKKRA